MKRIVINKTKNGCAYAIRARYSGAGITQLTQGGGHFPATGVLEIYEEADRCHQISQERGGENP